MGEVVIFLFDCCDFSICYGCVYCFFNVYEGSKNFSRWFFMIGGFIGDWRRGDWGGSLGVSFIEDWKRGGLGNGFI